MVPYRLVASGVSLSKKRVSRNDATNSKCLKHATGIMHFVRSAKRNCKVGLTEVQCGLTEKCAVGAEQWGETEKCAVGAEQCGETEKCALGAEQCGETEKCALGAEQCGETEKCAVGPEQSRTEAAMVVIKWQAAMVVIKWQCDCHCVDRVI